MKIIPCIIGLGYIGLPIILNLSNKLLTYKAGVAVISDSLNFKIFKKIKKYNYKVHGYDPFVGKKFITTYKIYNKINKSVNYDAIMFLSYHKTFEKFFTKAVLYKNKVLDPFNYYS